MNLKRVVIMKGMVLVSALVLGACAHKPQQVQSSTNKVGELSLSLNGAGQGSTELPNVELTQQILYEILLGDIAVQRGRPDIGVQAYLDVAKSTRDPRLAAHAARLSYEARQIDKAMEAFRLWQELEPKSTQAKQGIAIILLSGGMLEEARAGLVALLAAADTENRGNIFLQIYPVMARHPDKAAVYALVHDLAQPYPKLAEAQWAMAEAADAAGKSEVALQAAHQARILRPEWDSATMLEAQLLLRSKPDQALALVKKYLDDYPDSREMRLFNARLLTGQKQFEGARKEFQLLLGVFPNSPDLSFAVALLSLEMGELDRAEQELNQILISSKKDQDRVYYYLAQISDTRKQNEEALKNYRKVQEGEYVFPANLRIALLLGRLGKLDDARQHLHAMLAEDNQQRVQVVLVESQLLREAKQLNAAYQVLTQGLKKHPDHPDLLYDAGMVSSQLGKRDVFEKMMRKLIEVSPQNAQAYNALGYDMLDRNERVQEGMQLVEQAYALTPNDAAIIDSMGWGFYRLGDLVKSVAFLRRAYSANPDPEIAAHLGEVLWVQGLKDEATKILRQAIKDHPDNAVLVGVVNKFLQ
ncbi:MAG: tetratricopeptide repeat protein [Candidatus Nitrotoga sp.]